MTNVRIIGTCASICCIGPIVAVMFGMTSLAALSKYEPLRPIFGTATAVLLGVAPQRRAAQCREED